MNYTIFLFDILGLKFDLFPENYNVKITEYDSFPTRETGKTIIKDNPIKQTPPANQVSYCYTINYSGRPDIEINILKKEVIGVELYNKTLQHELKHAQDAINGWNFVAKLANIVDEGWYCPNSTCYKLGQEIIELSVKVYRQYKNILKQ